MGGASYVNVIYFLQMSPRLEHKQKELSITLCTVFNDLAVLAASLTSLLITSNNADILNNE